MDSNRKWEEVSFSTSTSLDGKNSPSQEQESADASVSGSQSTREQVRQPSDGISKSIADIIRRRKELANRVTPVCQHLSQLRNEISRLDQCCKQLVKQLVLTTDNVDIDRKLESIKFDFLEKELEKNIEELEKLIRRLSRDTLNIGVLGRMGQGKSTFLKSLSGLDVIPARQGGACTAVRSKFFHHSGDTEATVKFHSEKTFLSEVVGEYYRVLELGSTPDTLKDFANNSLPSPSSISSTTHREVYSRLKNDYYANFEKYKILVEDASPRETIITVKEEIQKYVSQERDIQTNQLTSFEHLAVREVEIRCCFPKVEVYGLGLIDVPGLGDTKIGDEKVILETLKEEVDVVLLVRKPDVDRYQWDDDFPLYQLAKDALDNLSKRCFIVLNHRSYGGDGEDNMVACNSLKENTQSIDVVGSPIIANCSNSSEANKVLDLVLEYLNRHIVEIEEQYARSCESNLLKLYGAINTELEKAQNVLISYVSSSRQFETSFKKIIGSLSEGLNQILNDLWDDYEATDTDFKQVVDDAIQECQNNKGIPSEEEIEKLIHLPENKNDYKIVYLTCAAELRSHLSKNFLTLDQGLQNASDKLKCLIADALISRGGLSELATSLDVKEVEFLEAMRKMLEDRQNRLELGFKTLLDFKMSYGALIMESIRKDLGDVFGGVRANSLPKPYSKNVVKTGAEILGDVAGSVSKIIKSGIPEIDKVQPVLKIVANAANAIATHLELEVNDKASVQIGLNALHEEAVTRCKKTLEDWEKAPSRLRYYMAEEFVDRVLYDKGIEEEWRHFLSADDIRSKVWVEFKQIEDRKQVQADWLSAVKIVRELNQQKLLVFS
jgi:hypothetical protein